MPRPTHEQMRKLVDPVLVHQWNFTLATAPAGLPDTEELNLRCLTSTLPKNTGESVLINSRGHQIKRPGIYKPVGTINITLLETEDMLVSSFIKAWEELCWAPNTGVSANFANIEATVILTLLNKDDDGIWEYKMFGCFLEDNEPGELGDGSGSEPLKPSIVMSYDRFERNAL